MIEPDPYELFAIRYATAVRNPADVFIGADPHEAPIPMDYFVWVARSRAHTVVIDTGFDAAAAQRRGRRLLLHPGEGLGLLGIDPQHVEHLVITHLHYDHAGCLELFPRARIHLQERELAYATGRHMGHACFAQAYDLEAVLTMVRLVYGARVQFHDGDAQVLPGLSVHHIGGHTLGLQAVRVWTRVGWVVLASDAVHYLENMTSGRPFPIVADVTQMVQGWERVRSLAGPTGAVIPGHDPLVMRRYREPEPDLLGKVVRLDAEPQLTPGGTAGGASGTGPRSAGS